MLDITPDIKISKFLAPIAKGDPVGTITYVIDGVSYSSDLLAAHDVYSGSYINFVFILVGILIILVIVFVIVYKKL